MADGLPVERLRQYLKELKPEAQALLIAELERGLLRGDDMPGAELVLQELRRSARESGRPAQRIGSLARLFFQPLEPFLVDDSSAHKHPGRIARAVLEPVWEWIARDLMPGEVKAVSEELTRVSQDDDVTRANVLARGFQDRVALRMREALDVAASDEKARRRLAAQIGTPRAIDDARAVLNALQLRDALAAWGARLPGHIKSLADIPLDKAKGLLDQIVGEKDMFLLGLVIVMSRLAAPWQLIRLATRAAGSDVAARVAETPYAIAIPMVLAEIERMVGELKSELHTGRGVAVGALLKTVHDAVRGVRTEINLGVDSEWARALADLRGEISQVLKTEIESMPGRVRRLLRLRPAREIAAGSVLDRSEVVDTEAAIEFVNNCRLYAGELAINELTLRAWSELEQYLEANTQPLVDSLRQASEADRNYRQSQLDAAVRFCTVAFGQEYAALLTKAGDLALSGERKAARA